MKPPMKMCDDPVFFGAVLSCFRDYWSTRDHTPNRTPSDQSSDQPHTAGIKGLNGGSDQSSDQSFKYSFGVKLISSVKLTIRLRKSNQSVHNLDVEGRKR